MPDPVRPTPPRALTVGITTRNRPASLARCLASLALIDQIANEIIVVDDSSTLPIREALDGLPRALLDKVTFVAQAGEKGYIVARNAIMRLATNDYVLLLDDDACLVDGRGVHEALALIDRSPEVAAVACALAEADGSPWPAHMQPSPVSYICSVPAFIGFAHLLRRRLFLDLGGYREVFRFYGEEKDYCLRALDEGYQVVYVPDTRVAHIIDMEGRNQTRHLRYMIRNDCLNALFNEPLPLPLATVPLRLVRYLRVRHHDRVSDPGGFIWILRELAAALPRVMRERKPVKWTTLKRWRSLRRLSPAYPPVIAA